MFRRAVLNRQSDRLAGEVALAVPLSWQALGSLLLLVVLGSGAFFSLATYARVETVSGVISPDRGVSAIVPTRTGLISSIRVHDGQSVDPGFKLATVRTEEDGAATVSPATQIEASIARQDASLVAQLGASYASAQAQVAQLVAQRAGLIAEIGQLRQQTALQRQLIATARSDLDSANRIASRGFISGRDLRAREEALLARQQGLAQLEQSLAAKNAALTENRRAAVQINAQSRAQGAGLAAARAEVAQQAARATGARSA